MVRDSLINNDVYGSDHCPVELLLDISKTKSELSNTTIKPTGSNNNSQNNNINNKSNGNNN